MLGHFFPFTNNFQQNLLWKIKSFTFGPLDYMLDIDPTQNPFPHLSQICLGIP